MTTTAARPDDDKTTAPAAEDAPRKSRAWRWWLLGVVCAVGLGIFMWAVGGCWNVAAPRPSGPAATPQEAVQKFMAAVDRHDKKLAESYCSSDFAERGQVDEWIGRAGYLRFVDAAVVSEIGTRRVMRVRYDLVTHFLDDQDPKGLNLAFVVFPERLTTFFYAESSASGAGWLVTAQGNAF